MLHSLWASTYLKKKKKIKGFLWNTLLKFYLKDEISFGFMTFFNPEDRALVKAFVNRCIFYVTVSESIGTISEDLLLSGTSAQMPLLPPPRHSRTHNRRRVLQYILKCILLIIHKCYRSGWEILDLNFIPLDELVNAHFPFSATSLLWLSVSLPIWDTS